MIDPNFTVNKRWVRRAFDRAAESYDAAAVMQREVCNRLDQRLEMIRLQPEVILDVGAGTGHGLGLLMQRYKKAQLIALDIAPAMLKRAAKQGSWRRKPHLLCADAEFLPLADASVDMVFSNLMLQWSGDLARAFGEFRRVLRPGGVLMFTTFGPDTLKELRHSWAAVDQDVHVNRFIDMHDIGDLLVRSRLADPVIDREEMVLTYPDVTAVMRDLKAIGANTPASGRKRGLSTRNTLKSVATAYETFRNAGVLTATYEIIYGQAWIPE